jgi:hypothetical protein
LVDLLDMLKGIEGKDGAKPSVLKAVNTESISLGENEDAWLCLCENYAEDDGFYTCDEDGNWIEGFTDGEWDNLYRCQTCGRVIDQRVGKVIGINLNPTGEEE